MLHGRAGGSQVGGAARWPSRAPSLAYKSGGARWSVFRQQARLSVWEVISEQLCLESGKAGGQREGELLSPRRQGSAWWGTKALASTISLDHPPAKIPKGTIPARELACTGQTPNAVLLWSHPSSSWSDSLLLPQGPS